MTIIIKFYKKNKMGKATKEHRKKVQARNLKIKADTKKREKSFQEMFMKQLDNMKLQMSGDTDTSETVNLNTDGFIQSAEII